MAAPAGRTDVVSGRLAGRVALVTGASGGIGHAICRRFAAEGATVVLTDVTTGAAADLAPTLEGSGHLVLPLDVVSSAGWTTVVAEVGDRLGRLDILVNNAAVGFGHNLVDETEESWDDVVAVTQKGVWLGMKYAGPFVAESAHGSIINMCSIFGTVGGFGAHASYHAAKGAVRTMTKNAAVYFGPQRVRVNSIHPGFIDGELGRSRRSAETTAAMVGGSLLGRLGSPEDVAGATAFLASDDAAFVTGSELYVDGGWTAR